MGLKIDIEKIEFKKILPSNDTAGKNLFRSLGFKESSQANIVSTINDGKIIIVNKAACKLLGYSKKELLGKERKDIFDKKNASIKNMLKTRQFNGELSGIISMINKDGEQIPCEVTSVIFKVKDGIENGIIIISDLREKISKQIERDSKIAKIVANDVSIAKSKQKTIDIKNAKIIAHNISLAKSKQKIIDKKNSKAVAHNISLAISRQNKIDIQNANVVAKNIVIAIAKQIEIDVKNAKVVATDIAQAIAKQKTLDANNAKIVAKNIVEAISKQIKIDVKNAKVVRDNIALAISNHANAILEAKENERSEIGKELHDNVNQLLGASKLYMDMAKKDGNNRALYLNKSSEFTLMAIEEIRKLTKGLTAEVIQNMGLCDAIDGLIMETMMASNLKITSECDSFKEESIDYKFKINIYRIIQEQFNNILKHSQATKVEIRLTQNKKSLNLFIRDNGIGFDPNKKVNGIGLSNIKSRVASNEGSIRITSASGKGCLLSAKFNIPILLI